MVLLSTDYGSFILLKIAELERKSGVKASLAEKIVLAETGTVEQVLSILSNSQICVVVSKQNEDHYIVSRESWITSSKSGANLIHAKSKIFAQNLPKSVVTQIKYKTRGIGSIISGLELETYRKIIEIGYNPRKDSFFRIYQIFHNKKIIFEIEEEIVRDEYRRKTNKDEKPAGEIIVPVMARLSQ